jgi:hypothetical protein
MFFGMLNIVGFTAFTVLFFKNNSSYVDNMLNLIILSLGLLLYFFTFGLFLFDPDPFDYFRYTFKRNTISMSYYCIYPICIISCVILL